jgi:hypothetical protein
MPQGAEEPSAIAALDARTKTIVARSFMVVSPCDAPRKVD